MFFLVILQKGKMKCPLCLSDGTFTGPSTDTFSSKRATPRLKGYHTDFYITLFVSLRPSCPIRVQRPV